MVRVCGYNLLHVLFSPSSVNGWQNSGDIPDNRILSQVSGEWMCQAVDEMDDTC